MGLPLGSIQVAARVRSYNTDARLFVAFLRGREPVPGTNGGLRLGAPVWFDHAIMNLPQTAVDFLDAFRGYLYTHKPPHETTRAAAVEAVGAEAGDPPTPPGLRLAAPPAGRAAGAALPLIHVHCFEKELEGEADSSGAVARAVARAAAALGCDLPVGAVDAHVVRYVSPQKPMLCLTFRLPRAAALAPPVEL